MSRVDRRSFDNPLVINDRTRTLDSFDSKSVQTSSKAITRAFGFGWWIWKTLSATVIGLVLIALFRGIVPAVIATVDSEAMMGAVIGFGAFLVIPVAAVLSMLLIVGIPLGLLALILFFVALYLDQMPVAVWLGRRLLSLAGGTDPSPYVAIVIGLVLLNLAYAIPWLGGLVWLVAAWLGLGATILVTRSYVRGPA